MGHCNHDIHENFKGTHFFMLEAIDLCKNFRDLVALDHLNITVHPGEIFGLLGANGAGKTTTISLFLDFIKPTSGEARINGVEVRRNSSAIKQDLAHIPEQVMLYRHMTGLENLRYFGALVRDIIVAIL